MNMVTDLDGTICDYTHRLAHLKSRNWDAFNNLCLDDKPILPILDIVKAMNNAAASEVAIKYQLHGFNQTVFTACSAGTNAIGQAYRHIKDGYADCMVAGGVVVILYIIFVVVLGVAGGGF